ncbi:hypothetical protein [Mycobacterium sp. IS-3022]|uniref:hypothetical protein n=1 Tax=Mycobacterium sp. IS-3022 TaxID=1772277 RepID=UPI0012E36679|nr:hypothetical protein [Mycobacterium sp. IS-3022]
MTIYGRLPGVAEAIAAAYRSHGIAVCHGRPPCGRPTASRWTGTVAWPASAAGSDDEPLEAAILILDADAVESLFGDGHSRPPRRRLRACESDCSQLGLAAVATRGARRVLVVCDVRRLSFGQRMRARRWVRNLAHRIAYESSINGFDELATALAEIGTDEEVAFAAAAAVDWHRREQLSSAAQPERLPLSGADRHASTALCDVSRAGAHGPGSVPSRRW